MVDTTRNEKIRFLETAWKDAQKESENERNPEAVRETYDQIAQRYFMQLQEAKSSKTD